MAKYAAQSNQPVLCQRRRRKRFKIPKVNTEEIISNKNKQTNKQL
jgi:hypothetical protein